MLGAKQELTLNLQNLIGSFSQPKLVISDTAILKSLSRKEMVCGYAEILKHAVIKDQKIF